MNACACLCDIQIDNKSSVALAQTGQFCAHVITHGEAQSILPNQLLSNQLLSNQLLSGQSPENHYIVVLDAGQRVHAFCCVAKNDLGHSAQLFDHDNTFHDSAIITNNAPDCFLEVHSFIFALQDQIGLVQNVLWQAMLAYCHDHHLTHIIGCIKFSGQYPAAHALVLSYLYHYAAAEPHLMLSNPKGVSMDIMPKEAIKPEVGFAALPPMLQLFLRHGAKVGNRVVVDKAQQQINLFAIVSAQQKQQKQQK